MITLTAQFPAPAETVLPVAFEAACLLYGPRKKAVEGENFLCLPILMAHVRFSVSGLRNVIVALVISAKPLGEDRCEVTVTADNHDPYEHGCGYLLTTVTTILRNTAAVLFDPQ